MHAYIMGVELSLHKHIYPHACIHTYILLQMHAYIYRSTWNPGTSILTHKYIHSSTHACIHFTHTHIHTYIHTFYRRCLHTLWINVESPSIKQKWSKQPRKRAQTQTRTRNSNRRRELRLRHRIISDFSIKNYFN